MIIDDPNDLDEVERKIKFAEIAREFAVPSPRSSARPTSASLN